MSRETLIHAVNVSHSRNILKLGYSEIFDACHFALESTTVLTGKPELKLWLKQGRVKK